MRIARRSRAFLRSRGVDYWWQPHGVSIGIDLGDVADAALAVERVNAEIGFPVWRVLPTLAATYTATLDHTGALSSRILEYALALLRLALVRDRPALRKVPGVSAP